MPFSRFVNDIYNCIKEHANRDDFTLNVFSEGPEVLKEEHLNLQDYAVLRNEYALAYHEVMEFYRERYSLKIEYKLEKSILLPNSVKVTHSCYPKNLRRWMKGTISRKQKCRAELCALIYCWYDLWLKEISPDADKGKVATELSNLCDKYMEHKGCEIISFDKEILWKACEGAYRKTLIKWKNLPKMRCESKN